MPPARRHVSWKALVASLLATSCLQAAGIADFHVVEGAGGSGAADATVDALGAGGSSDSADAGGGAGASEGGTGGETLDALPGCPIPPGQVCGTQSQCGCGSGDNCVVAESTKDGNAMCALAGVNAEDARCSSNEECQRGLMCRLGVCRRFCGDATDCVLPSSVCEALTFVDDTGNTVPLPNVKVCKRRCDPSDASPCGAGQACFLYKGSDGTWLTQCIGAGTATGTNGCSSDLFACASGYVCTNYSDCRSYCRVGANDCQQGTHCQPNSSHALVSGVEYGNCATDCDPLQTPSACQSTEKCFPIGGLFDDSVALGFTDCIGAGTGAQGDDCTATTACAASLACYNGTCHALCRVGTAADCPADSSCQALKAGFSVAGAAWGTCQKSCDPLAPAAVCEKGNCRFIANADSQGFHTDCSKAGNGPALSACTSTSDCAAGLFCNAQGFCNRFCRVGNASDCSEGACEQFTDHPILNGAEYGLCQPRCIPSSPAATCGTSHGCTLVTEGSTTYSKCIQAAAANPASCQSQSDCAARYYCSQTDTCNQWCRVGVDADCSAGATCHPFTTPLMSDGLQYGSCQ